MVCDFFLLLIYIALGLFGVIASAYKNKKKAQKPNAKPYSPAVPRTFTADPQTDFGPDLGPLVELFDLPRRAPVTQDYETIERGPSVEEDGMNVDTEEASAELAGMDMEKPVPEAESIDVVPEKSFEEGQSDIQKMLAKYEAIRKELDESDEDDIAKGEIMSVENEEKARLKRASEEKYFNPRKAIIYSEILKRKEY
jgi:hypothetical protein